MNVRPPSSTSRYRAIGDPRDFRVALVSMPFASIFRPSIQLGLLTAICRDAGFRTDAHHAYLDFAGAVGPDVFEAIAESGRCFPGDWLFSEAAFGPDAPDPDSAFLHRFDTELRPGLEKHGHAPSDLQGLRDVTVPRYLDDLLEEVDWTRYQVVGFTTTFQQTVASIALAERIKQAAPETVVVFGGANCDDVMGLELLQRVPAIDYCVIGEGDHALPALLTALRDGQDVERIRGVATRENGSARAIRAATVVDLDALPFPDYDDYFARVERLGLLSTGPSRPGRLPFESARGCWWGEKHHCTFCGLNGNGMTFRSKSSARVRDELNAATQRYRSWRFAAVDNIMEMAYIGGLMSDLATCGDDYDLFYEVKANLRRDQIRTLALAGVTSIQPGIESMSTPVLRLMDKGSTASQNVNTLRWARYYGIDVTWNVLYGFPGETVEDYAAQARLFPSLVHLAPPEGAGEIWMERFSPMFRDQERFPLRTLAPHPSYRYVYPETFDLSRLAYFFEHEFVGSLPAAAYDGTHRAVDEWRARWAGAARPGLVYRSSGDFLQVEDTRDLDDPCTYTFRGPLARVLVAAGTRPRTPAGLRHDLDLRWSDTEIEEALLEFCARGLMMRDEDRFLSLPVPATGGR